jgi:hypothetical protein
MQTKLSIDTTTKINSKKKKNNCSSWYHASHMLYHENQYTNWQDKKKTDE